MILHIHKHAITCYYDYSVLTVSIQATAVVA